MLMSTNPRSQQYNAVLNDPSWVFPLNHAMMAVNILADFKGENLKVFDMKGSSMCDFNVIATAQNNLVIRDGVTSFYFHAYNPASELTKIINGVKAAGYTFVAPTAL